MLGSDLRVRRFTPLAERVMNLIPGDVGRPISDIKPKIDLPQLEQLVAEVIESVSTREVEVRDRDGKWYSLRVRPYKTVENKIDGAVLILVDIDVVKKASLEVQANTLFAEAVFDMARDGLATLDERLNLKAANPPFMRACSGGKPPIGRPLFELAGGRFSVPALKSALETLRSKGEPFTDLPLQLGGENVLASGRRLGEGRTDLILLSISPPVKKA